MPPLISRFKPMLSALSRTILLLGIVANTALAAAASINVTAADKNNAALNDAVIYAMPVSGNVAPPKRGGIVDQVDKEFQPYVTAVQTGTAVSFPNKDNIRHHVYSFSPAKTFELRLYSGSPSKPVVFDKPGAVVLGCNIHDWMLAYVYVVDTPYFATTTKGSARIDGIPAGEYELKAWHPQLRGAPPSLRITVGAQDSTHRIALDLAPKPSAGSANPAAKATP